ncbi:hypothetical protein EVAR_77345_1 [Eumeta japonica]|uniref:Uncharacterized protein n=1 Tax=Eumeta variegata TaxID=151549 RepID=A0A4C1UXS3_EUMVA|nr:hypothetical protein EVAR_77345_1 [Eumeta japonica]
MSKHNLVEFHPEIHNSACFIAYPMEGAPKSYATSPLPLIAVIVPLAVNTISTISMAGVLLSYASCAIFCHVGNASVAPSKLQVATGGGDNLLPGGPCSRLPVVIPIASILQESGPESPGGAGGAGIKLESAYYGYGSPAPPAFDAPPDRATPSAMLVGPCFS